MWFVLSEIRLYFYAAFSIEGSNKSKRIQTATRHKIAHCGVRAMHMLLPPQIVLRARVFFGATP